KQCPDVRKALKTMFPEAFEENKDKHFDLSPLGDSNGFIFPDSIAKAAGFEDKYFLKVADLSGSDLELHQKAFYLHGSLTSWELRPMSPSNYSYLLIPTPKHCKESGE
ncbi:hypothetical protein LCGC14_2646710, partial [marine sediment metagenome]